MVKPDEFVMCIISAQSGDAESIAEAVIRERLGACVQITSAITSYYRWEGKIRKDPEVLIFIKTEQNAVNRIKSLVSEIHPYEVPEFIVIPVIDGLKQYLDWVKDSITV